MYYCQNHLIPLPSRLLALAGLLLLQTSSFNAAPISLHAENGHYFDSDGKASVLIGAGEHYGAVINTDFDYLRYLDEVRACGLNLVRIFSGPYLEMPGAFDIVNNTLAPTPGKLIVPWVRTETPGALGGGNKFDLTKWNAAYFHRLRGFVQAAGERGIVVELTLFCPFYNVDFWNLSPLNPGNHINGVGAAGLNACFQANSDLLPFQKALARKCLEELRPFDNVYFEVINEPYQGEVSNAWQALIIDELVAALAEVEPSKRHLIAQNVANYEGVINSPNPAVSIFNFHYAKPDAARLNQGLNRVIGDDETGFAGRTDFPYRREGWEFMLAGGGLFSHLDSSFTIDREDGLDATAATSGGGPSIRRQLGLLRWFLEELPLVRCAPQAGFITSGVPVNGAVEVLGAPGEAYGLYLRGGTQATLSAALPAGTWRGRWIDPRSGAVTARIEEFTHAGGSYALQTPVYGEDVSLLLIGGNLPPPEIILTSPGYQTVGAADADLVLSAEASITNGEILRVEFLKNDGVIGTDDTAPYSITLPGSAAGHHVFRAKAIAVDGRSAQSPPVKCSLMGAYQSGVNLNGPGLVFGGQNWTAEADAISAGMSLTNIQPATSSASLPIYPSTDALARTLVTSQVLRLNSSGNPEVGIAFPLPDGNYDVFFSLVEGETAYLRDVRVSMEGNVVAQGIGNLALGEWVNYGPYRVSVSDGVLNLGFTRETKGNPKVANFSIYQAEQLTPVEEAFLSIGTAPGVVVLSMPKSGTAGILETAIAMDDSADWQDSTLPVEDFEDYFKIVAPADEERRFFRLRMD